MPEYDVMYTKLFNAITTCITILQQAQIDTEEQYANAEPPALILLEIAKKMQEDTDNP